MDFTLKRKQKILRLLTFHTMMLRNTGDALKDLFNQAKFHNFFQPEPTKPVPDKKSQDTKISPVIDAKS